MRIETKKDHELEPIKGLVGLELEFFVIDNKTKRPIIPSLFLKKAEENLDRINIEDVNEYSVEDIIDNYSEDGMALEWQSIPKRCRDYMHDQLITLDIFNKSMEEILDVTISASEIVDISEEQMEQLPKENKRLGCSPDFNVYTGKMNDKTGLGNQLFRTGGGHIHFGELPIGAISPILATKFFAETHNSHEPINYHNKIIDFIQNKHLIKLDKTKFLEDSVIFYKGRQKLEIPERFIPFEWVLYKKHTELMVKAFDLFVGVPSVMLNRRKNVLKRRSMYGQAGDYRPKDYGIEYRVCSNHWGANPMEMYILVGGARYPLNIAHNYSLETLKKIVEKYEEYTKFAIEKNRADCAENLLLTIADLPEVRKFDYPFRYGLRPIKSYTLKKHDSKYAKEIQKYRLSGFDTFTNNTQYHHLVEEKVFAHHWYLDGRERLTSPWDIYPTNGEL